VLHGKKKSYLDRPSDVGHCRGVCTRYGVLSDAGGVVPESVGGSRIDKLQSFSAD
jgi:hypothetical protein